MDVADLKRLALTAAMYQLDISPGFLTLGDLTNVDSHDEVGGIVQQVMAWYRSAFTCAGTFVVGEFGDVPVAVRAKDFADGVSLFDTADNPVALRVTDGWLYIKSQRRTVKLKRYGQYEEMAAATMAAINAQCEEGAVVSSDAFMPEAVMAASMAAPKSTSGILTGIRFRAQGDKIVLQSADGQSVFQTVVPAQVTAPIDVVIPADDLVTALRLIGRGGAMVKFAATERNLSFVTATSAVRIPALVGEWPPLTKIAQQTLSEPIQIASASIRKVASAAKLYGMITWFALKPTPEGILLTTPPTEGGQFEELVSGHVAREYRLGLTAMDNAAKLGHFLDVAFGETAARVSVPGTSRILYTLLRPG